MPAAHSKTNANVNSLQGIQMCELSDNLATHIIIIVWTMNVQ